LIGAPALYLITDRRAASRPLPELVAQAIREVDPRRVAVQLREKDLCARELLLLGSAVLEVCRARGVPLLVNERVDVALALGADGVHLGAGALPAREVRRIWPQARIGVSCHSSEELVERSDGADFAAWGPVFATPSKAQFGPPLGSRGLAEARAMGVPLVALGGINSTNAGGLSALGFSGIACIRAVFSAQDPAAAATNLLAAFDRG
jgi:thiamine-phosphate pyrophosphorylase